MTKLMLNFPTQPYNITVTKPFCRIALLDASQLDTLSKQAEQAMNSGDCQRALQLTREIQTLKEHYILSPISNRFLVNVAGLLINIGNLLGDQQVIHEGIDLLNNNLDKLTNDKRYAPIAYYDLGNGYSALFDIKMKQQPSIVYFSDTELNLARGYYTTSLQYKHDSHHLNSQVWVNLGNTFDALGRVLDALECYEKALTLDPDHGMALGNKGVSLYGFARISGEHQGTFLKEAYSLLSLALKKGVDVEAINHFESYIKAIRSHFRGKESTLDNPPEYPGITTKGAPGLEEFLTSFCLNNKLYLNICNYCQRCDAAVGDTALIKKMILPLTKHDEVNWPKNDKYLRLSKYLNQIKQDFVTSRFLLILSRYRDLNLNFVDKRVKIINTLDYPLHNIYVELLKSSFKGFYGVLDKIAYFIADYLALNKKDRDIYFRTVWYRTSRRGLFLNKYKILKI